MVRYRGSSSFRILAFLHLRRSCRNLRLSVGIALCKLSLSRENFLELVVGDAHRQAEFFEMQLGEDSVVVFADQHPDHPYYTIYKSLFADS